MAIAAGLFGTPDIAAGLQKIAVLRVIRSIAGDHIEILAKISRGLHHILHVAPGSISGGKRLRSGFGASTD